MTGFTPGPWRVEPCTHTVWGPAPEDDTRTWGNPICEARATDRHFGRIISPTEAGANAHLIAAAPEMFEALDGLFAAKDALADFEREHPDNTTKAWDDLFYAVGFAEDAARVALAKAKGETT